MRYASCPCFTGNLRNIKDDYCTVKKTDTFECFYCEKYMRTLSPEQIEKRNKR